jgi:DNA adenine methylase
LLRYLGSKWRLAPWVLAHFPPHEIYCEPCGGAAAVLLQKEPARSETWNDIDLDLVNLFTVLRSIEAAELVRLCMLTPFARAEYLVAHMPTDDPVERARRLLIRSHMGHGSRGTRSDCISGFRRDGVSGSTDIAGNWADFTQELLVIIERLRRVSLESVPAVELLPLFDDPKALIYLDPPYVPETRTNGAREAAGYRNYAHEMSIEDHRELLGRARASRAMVLISGYASSLYDEMLAGWTLRTIGARSMRNLPRTECLWLNPLAASRLPARSLFDVAA